MLRYNVPGFEDLNLEQKKYLYYLQEAGLSGRDIIYDQMYKHGLLIRKTLEQVVKYYEGERGTDEFKSFLTYVKRVWVASGIHHHRTGDKLKAGFSKKFFSQLINQSPKAVFPMTNKELIKKLTPIIFNPWVAAKGTSRNSKKDLIKSSAVNFYEGVTQWQVENYYKKMIDPKDEEPVLYGLNTKVVKEKWKIKELPWKVGGLYTEAIEKIVFWLEQAMPLAENKTQKKALGKLIEFYKTGDLKTFDEYSILWVKDADPFIDVVNGFIENYDDPLGQKGTYESFTSIKDVENTKLVKIVSGNAQWFEDNAPIHDEYKKKDVKGISAKAIYMVSGAGETIPVSGIGVNLPNSTWIRKAHGSKSVSISNLTHAWLEGYKESGVLEEFAYSQEEVSLEREYGALADSLHTALHEVIGHASGKVKPEVGNPNTVFKSYYFSFEEARSDLFGLYYIMDPKLVELGLMPNLDVGKAAYNYTIIKGLMTQLARVKLGDDIEDSHTRNRYLIARWVLEKGKADNVIERKIRKGKTFYVINDYQKLRELFGQLLKEIQHIKSEGNYKAGKALVENYGVKPDPAIHKEVKERWAKLGVAPHEAFIAAYLIPEVVENEIVDVKIEYPTDFTDQMLFFGEKYSYLPVN